MGYEIPVSNGKKRSCHGNPEERFRVPRRLRTARFDSVFKVMGNWRVSCSQVLRSLKRVVRRRRSMSTDPTSKRVLVGHNRRAEYCRFMSSCAWSKSFHAEAISDCLEFIKRSSSVSADPSSLVAGSTE